MDKFEDLQAFVAVVEAGSFTAAGERLDTAKSAVSRRISGLEERLGVQLLRRTTRTLNLTDTGRAFYHQSVRILEDVLEAELATSQAHGTLKGSLKIDLPSTFGLMHMGPAINEFLQLHPQIEFDLDFNDREVDLIQEGFDLAIRIANLPDSSLIARRLAPIQTLMCASPSYLEHMGAPKTPEELIEHQCLVYSLLRDYEYWYLTDRNGKEIRTKIHPYLKASTGEFLKDASVEGLGIILVPSFIAYKEIELGTLVPVLKDYKPPQLEAYAIYPQTRHLSQRVRAFVDFLVKRFEGTPYWDFCLRKPAPS